MFKEIYLTRFGYDKLRAELEFLKTTRRVEITKDISEARAHGDISENAEYDAAKEAQAHNERKVAELEDKLSMVKIIDDLDIPSDKVYIGATVTLKNLDTNEEVTQTIVSGEELHLIPASISISSPVAKGLLGHKEGEEVIIKVPAGDIRYKILKIVRDFKK